jgi:hypothetical protein
LSGRRYVKDGPGGATNYRVASVMDMLSYVGFKNLLIGAACSWRSRRMGLLMGRDRCPTAHGLCRAAGLWGAGIAWAATVSVQPGPGSGRCRQAPPRQAT